MASVAPEGAPNSKRVRKPQIPESLLARLWRDRATSQESFKTSEGRKIKVLYTGRRGSEAGPDFRDALLYGEDVGLVRGDVELHLRPKDWNSHGHGADHRYNGVVLHGVLAGPGPPPRLRNGAKAPAVCLQPLLETLSPSNTETPKQRSFLWSIMAAHGYPEPHNRSEAQESLVRAGMARFWRKSKAFTALMQEIQGQEVMYQAILECLGYSENRGAFAELAQLLPYEALEKATGRIPRKDRPGFIEKMLLETSGLQSAEGEAIGSNPPMHPGRWHLFRIRPSNHPRRRMAGAAELLDRFLDIGLQTGVIGLARGCHFKTIQQQLTVPGPKGKPALIGKARASDIVVNAVLPLVHAWGLQNGDDFLAASTLDVYMRAPRLQSNRLIREMEEVLFLDSWRPMADTLPSQQGLIHFHHLAQGEG